MTKDYDDPEEHDREDAPLSDQNSADELADDLVSRFYSSPKTPRTGGPAPKTGPIKLPQLLGRQGVSAPIDISQFLKLMFSQKAPGAASTISPELRARREQIALLATKVLRSEDAALKWFYTPALFALSGAKPIDWLTSLQECEVVEGMLMKLYPCGEDRV